MRSQRAGCQVQAERDHMLQVYVSRVIEHFTSRVSNNSLWSEPCSSQERISNSSLWSEPCGWPERVCNSILWPEHCGSPQRVRYPCTSLKKSLRAPNVATDVHMLKTHECFERSFFGLSHRKLGYTLFFASFHTEKERHAHTRTLLYVKNLKHLRTSCMYAASGMLECAYDVTFIEQETLRCKLLMDAAWWSLIAHQSSRAQCVIFIGRLLLSVIDMERKGVFSFSEPSFVAGFNSSKLKMIGLAFSKSCILVFECC